MTNYEKMLEPTGVKATKEEVKTLAKLLEIKTHSKQTTQQEKREVQGWEYWIERLTNK